MNSALAAALLLAITPFALTQSPAPAFSAPADKPLTFEVASIHLHDAPLRSIAGFSSSGPRVRLEAYTLRHLIMEAYNLKSYQLHVPQGMDHPNTYYDIAATAPSDTSPTREDFRHMLQSLLADRFQLKAHFEKKETLVYALVVAKNGPRLEISSEQTPPKTLFGVNGRNQFVRTDNVTIPNLAVDLNGGFGVDRPVIDRTGLTGIYKLKIEATPEWTIDRDPQPGDLSIFTAVQEQLGLKLEPSTTQLDVLVIDSAQKPSEN